MSPRPTTRRDLLRTCRDELPLPNERPAEAIGPELERREVLRHLAELAGEHGVRVILPTRLIFHLELTDDGRHRFSSMRTD